MFKQQIKTTSLVDAANSHINWVTKNYRNLLNETQTKFKPIPKKGMRCRLFQTLKRNYYPEKEVHRRICSRKEHYSNVCRNNK